MRPLNTLIERFFLTHHHNAMSHAARDAMMSGPEDLITNSLPLTISATISEWLIAIDNQIIRLTGGFVD